jgi:hypothetical protein
MYCAKCGAEQQADARFCSSCGAQLAASTPPPATPPAQPPAPAPTPVPVPVPVPAVTPLDPQPTPPPARTGTPGWVIGCLIALVLVFLVVGALVVGWMLLGRARAKVQADLKGLPEVSRNAPDGPTPEPPSDVDKPEPSPDTSPEPPPTPAPVVSSEDPVAEATVVLEQYLAADLGHDGNEMKKYLGGQASARFKPEVQGQENLTVHSETVASHVTKDSSTIVFKVEVLWSPEEDPGTVKTTTDSYTLKKTDKGWKIVSTPAYP